MLRWLVYQLQVYLRRKDRVDKFRGHPKTALVRELVKKGRWSELEALYASLRQDEKNVVTSGLADVMQAGAFDDWANAGGSALAHSLKGHLELDLAWRVRSGAAASLVRKDAWKEYFAHLRTAFGDLRAANELDPSDPEPSCAMIRVLMGWGDRVAEMHERFDQIEGFHLPAANHLLDGLTEKWGGSHQQMFAFARTICGRNPCYGSVLALAHVERWFAAGDGDDNEDPKSYFQKPHVRDEIIEAYERDALLAGHELSYFALFARSVYGFAFWKMNDRPRASKELNLVGRHLTEKPWAYGGFLRFGALNAARKECGLAALERVAS